MCTGERSFQTIRGQMRTLVLQLQGKIGIELPPDCPMPWATRHAAWLHNRFHQRKDTNPTPFEKVHLKNFFGAQLHKLDMHWLNGIWLGRDSKTDEHFISTEGGIVRARAIRRMVEAQLWIPERDLAMQWTPWEDIGDFSRATTEGANR